MSDNPNSISARSAATELLRRQRARGSLVEYARSIDIPGAPASSDPEGELFKPIETAVALHHRVIMDAIQRCMTTQFGRLMIQAPPGSAKALALDTPIPTPTGWTTMGELRAGDQVFDEHGRPCNVVWVSPVWAPGETFDVETDCGDTIRAHADHEWRVRLCGKPVASPNCKPFKIKETRVLAKHRQKRAMIERAAALQLPARELPVDPYVLGAWLGDGTTSTAAITASVEDQRWLRPEIERLGYPTRNRSVPVTFGVGNLRAGLVQLGVLHDPWHNTYGRKHIPMKYLRASVSQRLALLQGLVDTDGTVCKKRGCVTFCNTNLELALQVRELVCSLGVKAGWSEGRAICNGKDCGPVYRVSFYHAQAARMPRKAALCRDQYRTPNTYVSAKPAPPTATVCIEVDSPSHLYLAGRSMTPTHNSSYASVVAPVWAMSKFPGWRLILASYAADLAEKQSRKARSLARQTQQTAIWPERPELTKDQKAVANWSLSNGSEYMASGFMGGITGNRANGVIIDDPFSNREAADSPTIRAKVEAEYHDTVTTRLLPGGFVILINTRWHWEDLSGVILPENYAGESGRILCRDGQEWEVINIPAKAEHDDDPLGRKPGEYLWPEWFPARHWALWENNPRAARTWSALYQQRPSPDEGIEFRREWFQWYDPDAKPGSPTGRPLRLAVYGASDYATLEDRGDFTEHGLVGIDHTLDWWFLDWWYGQKTTDIGIAAMIGLLKVWMTNRWWHEGGPIDNAISPAIDSAMKLHTRANPDRPIWVHREALPSIKNKMLKASAFQSVAAAGKVHLPLNREWATRLVDQLCKFPTGKHDDAVDVCGLLGRGMDSMIQPFQPTEQRTAKGPRPFTGEWLEWTENQAANLKGRIS